MKKSKTFKTYGKAYLSHQARLISQFLVTICLGYMAYRFITSLPFEATTYTNETLESFKYPAFGGAILHGLYTLWSKYNKSQVSKFVFPYLQLCYSYYNVIYMLLIGYVFSECIKVYNLLNCLVIALICTFAGMYFLYTRFLIGQDKLVARDFKYKRFLTQRAEICIWITLILVAFIFYSSGSFDPYYWVRPS